MPNNGKTPKIIGLFLAILLILCLPFLLVYLLFKILATPFDYVKYKRSRYQKDFPHRYSWLIGRHYDNDAYTAIKENNLPVEYFKPSNDYHLCGYFVYRDVLLDFTEPLFFDEEEKVFLRLPEEDEWKETDDDACLTIEDTKALILGNFHDQVPERECHKVVFFYSRKNVERDYMEEGLNAMRKLDGFILYEKGELAKAIGDWIENN